jgi:hypothetical protein
VSRGLGGERHGSGREADAFRDLRVADPRERIRDLRGNYRETVCSAGPAGAECVASAYVKSANVIVVIVAIVAASVRITAETAGGS